MPTVIDVAKRAGVSISTVSYAISGTRPIAAETRQRIFQVMDELGYKPNVLARALASKRSRIISLLFPVSKRGLGATELEFVTSATQAAQEHGYHLVLWSAELPSPEALLDMTQQGLVDGLVMMEVHLNDARVALLQANRFPFSLIGRCAENEGLWYVDIDFEQTMRDAARHLLDFGHRQIAYLNQDELDSGYGPAVRTLAGFEQIMQANRLPAVTAVCDPSPLAGYVAMQKLWADLPELTALLVMNDRALPGILQAIAERGRSIPDDFSLLTVVSSAQVAEMMAPPLTAMEPPAAELGRMGVELLVRQLESQEETAVQALMPCRLVVRGSTGPRAG
ncbi:MAG: LacI family DNA-binding transcriptional regulator [Chloroflexota bacterium]